MHDYNLHRSATGDKIQDFLFKCSTCGLIVSYYRTYSYNKYFLTTFAFFKNATWAEADRVVYTRYV